MSAQLSHDEIRRMVRELLRDAVAGGGAASVPARDAEAVPAVPARAAEVGGLSERVRQALASGGGGGVEIAITSDSDLNAFAQQVALCALERDLLGAIASNRVRFRLAGGRRGDAAVAAGTVTPAASPAAASDQDGGAYHWEQGLLSETKITEIARSHSKLVLGRRAFLTPLAWDRARSLGLQVMRMRP